MLGTPGFATDKNRPQLLDGKSGWLAAVLGVCHNEAHVDKEDPPPGQGNQTLPYVFISTAFGYEAQKVVVDLIKIYFDFWNAFCVSVEFGSCAARNMFP